MSNAPTTTSPRKRRAPVVKDPSRLRISAKLRSALNYIAIHGLPARQAAERAGLHEVSVYKALAKPHVQEALDELKAQVCLEAEGIKGVARALAIQEGLRLMRESPSHAVRARMVEFFAGEPKSGTQVNVAVNVDRGGYEFVRPGARVVDITPPAPDLPSPHHDGQAIDDAEEC